MSENWSESVQAYAQAAAWFQEVLSGVGDRWADPGLGEWDIRSLAGHTTRALLTVETYLARPAALVEVDSAWAYYRAGVVASASDAAVAQRGREAGLALGDDPVLSVAEIATRVLSLVDGLSGEEYVTTIAGGMRLSDYLPTRVLELTVHTADLAVALGLPDEPPSAASLATLRLVCELAVAGGTAAPLMRAATGRGGLPEGSTVL